MREEINLPNMIKKNDGQSMKSSRVDYEKVFPNIPDEVKGYAAYEIQILHGLGPVLELLLFILQKTLTINY